VQISGAGSFGEVKRDVFLRALGRRK
jgi:hypothetical protein